MNHQLAVMKTVQVIDRVATGQAIKERRLKLGLTLQDIATALNTHTTEIHRLEKGQLPVTPELIKRVATALKR